MALIHLDAFRLRFNTVAHPGLMLIAYMKIARK